MPSLVYPDRRIIAERYILSTQPTLYLPLWKKDGNAFVSDDANGFSVTNTGALWTPQGRTLDGNDYISVPLSLTPPFTMLLWAKCSELPSVAGRNTCFADGSVVNEFNWGIGGTDYIFVNNPTTINGAILGAGILNWHLYYVVVNGASSSVGYDDIAPTTGTLAATTTTSPLRFGIVGNDSVTFRGTMGKGLIYNRILSAAEILNLYLATKWRYV